MEQIQPPKAPSGRSVNPRIVILVLVILLVAAAIAILMQQCSSTGLGGSGTNPTATGSGPSNDQQIKVTIKDTSCSINDGAFTGCVEVCEQIKNRTDKTGLVVLVNGRDGLVEKIKELKECLSAAGITHAATRE